ncbi:KTSC domain-containing protein [Herbihabitans rhizosphaerae]|uniref:KTSC domain-containing protein n=1 Tax=Herbihabitans rhizosphaerae TaxID=1872711 RepID=A0A4Q7KX77_9PSEU|nr:KTSC domain-containing protein [Herbihabitans rhizosphaerae]RZS41317.1 KTSC domain-containing protein [Herbihabitans rhizosphaerae]
MKRKPVKSSVLRSIGYDKDSKVLEIEFSSTDVYHYFVVPRSVFAELMDSSSPGRFFNERIRDRYPMRQVG